MTKKYFLYYYHAMIEFDGTRSQLYKEALAEFPDARQQDIDVMYQYLQPQKEDRVLEVGAGGGFFSGLLADAVHSLVVSDESVDQLTRIESFDKPNISVVAEGADEFTLEPETFSAVWSFGAVHHIDNRTAAFENFYKMLEPGGRLCIVDVFSGSTLAEHFDEVVARYSVSGHDVSFLSHAFTKSLCHNVGFENVVLEDLDIQWVFDSEEDVGVFLYKLHAMTLSTPENCFIGAKEIIGVEEKDEKYFLNWPLTVCTATKSI